MSPAFSQLSVQEARTLIMDLAGQQVPLDRIASGLIEQGLTLDEAVEILSSLIQTDTPDELIATMTDSGLDIEVAAVIVTANNNTSSDQTQNRAARLRQDGLALTEAAKLVVAMTTGTTAAERMDSLSQMGIPLEQAGQFITRLTLTAPPARVFQGLANAGVSTTRVAEIMSVNSSNTPADVLLDTFVTQGVEVATAANLIVANQATAAITSNPQQLDPALQTALVNPAQPQPQLQESPLLILPALSPAAINNNLLTGSASGGTAVSTSQ
jgi:hypothetical protein